MVVIEAGAPALVGETTTSSATVRVGGGAVLTTATIDWSVEGEQIAQITSVQIENGVSTLTWKGIHPGSTMITARNGDRAASTQVFVGRGILRGRVVDAQTLAPIEGATVEFFHPDGHWDYPYWLGSTPLQTDAAGFYASPPLDLSSAEVFVSKADYSSVSLIVGLVDGQRTTLPNIVLSRLK